MNNLLKHLVEITGHRDHNLMDVSVISAIHDLVGATQVRVLEIMRVREELYIRPRAWLKDGKVVTLEDDGAEAEPSGEPISTYPELVDCIENRHNSLEATSRENAHVLWIPVWINDKVTSCIQIVNSDAYPAQTMDVLGGILSVYRNFQNLLDYSERDSLTGLLNRKTFDEKFSKMATQAVLQDSAQQDCAERRSHDVREQWLAVVDIDHFKKVNDTFGHLYGDEVLILVANLLRNSFRSQDRIFRFGGEEFVILLRSTTLEDAHRIFERFRTNVEQHHFPQVGRVTVSLGFVRITAETPVVILGHADQALYYAKEHGRNQICNYDELVSKGMLRSEVANDEVEFF